MAGQIVEAEPPSEAWRILDEIDAALTRLGDAIDALDRKTVRVQVPAVPTPPQADNTKMQVPVPCRELSPTVERLGNVLRRTLDRVVMVNAIGGRIDV